MTPSKDGFVEAARLLLNRPIRADALSMITHNEAVSLNEAVSPSTSCSQCDAAGGRIKPNAAVGSPTAGGWVVAVHAARQPGRPCSGCGGHIRGPRHAEPATLRAP
eukprot:2446047-Prymnesium_polylepis.1